MAHMNQCDMVLRFLNDFGAITQAQAIDEFGCYRLSAVIFKLRKSGYDIKTKPRTKINRYGRPVTFAQYLLEDEKNAG